MAVSLISNEQSLTIHPGNNIFLCTLDGNRCMDSRNLLNEMAAILRFPAHFGHNYDALYDCLTDLEWLGVDNIYLMIIHPNLICANEDVLSESHAFVRVMKSAIVSYKQHPVHFFITAEKSFLQLITPPQF